MEAVKRAQEEAEAWLYRYSALKRKDLKSRAQLMHDAIWPSTASTESAGVKSSNISDPTGRGGVNLAVAKYETLTDEERIWMESIEAARADLERENPAMSKCMGIIYGMDDWRPRTKDNRAKWRIQAMQECGVQRENTYYEWRLRILTEVICCRMSILEGKKEGA